MRGHAPFPRIHTNDWQNDAACAGTDSDMFFPSTHGGQVSKHAKQLCASCPVWRECLAYAKASPTSWQWGYWGGLGEVERRRLTLAQAIELAESRR